MTSWPPLTSPSSTSPPSGCGLKSGPGLGAISPSAGRSRPARPGRSLPRAADVSEPSAHALNQIAPGAAIEWHRHWRGGTGRQGFQHFGRDPDVGAAACGQREDQESSMHMATRCGAATARLAVCAAILDVRPAALSGRLRGSSQGHRGRPLPSTRTRGFWPELPVAGSAVVVGGPKTRGSPASTRRFAAYQRCRRCRREHGPPHAQPSFLGIGSIDAPAPITSPFALAIGG